MFKFGSVPAMLIHHKDGTMVALTAIVAWFLHWRSHAERVALA